jgi:hypothetical protein
LPIWARRLFELTESYTRNSFIDLAYFFLLIEEPEPTLLLELFFEAYKLAPES